MLKDLFLNFEGVLERNPVRAFVFLLVSHFAFFLLLIFATNAFPNRDVLVANIVIWIWLFWMIYLGVPTIRYLNRKYGSMK